MAKPSDHEIKRSECKIKFNLVRFEHLYTIENYSNFLAFSEEVDNIKPLPKFSVVMPNSKKELFFVLQLKPSDTFEKYLTFKFYSTTNLDDNDIIRYNIIILHNNQEKNCTGEKILHLNDCVYEDLDLDKALSDYLLNDTLTIKVVLTVCETVINHMKKSTITNKHVENLGLLFTNQEFCDVTISASGKNIKAHKAILAAQSPVFKAMFFHETNESTQNQLNITDIDYDVIKNMLQYMYTGDIPALDTMAGELLAAAEKYALMELKSICENTLLSSVFNSCVTVENVAHIIVFADLHNAEKLKIEALQFIKKHGNEVKKTPAWQLIMEKHSRLVTEILNFILNN